ncbi:PAAR motif protein [compost metagenome]
MHRKGDSWEAHTCPAIPQTHASVLAEGSATVFANGKPLSRIGDPVACGSSVATGSANVFAGG